MQPGSTDLKMCILGSAKNIHMDKKTCLSPSNAENLIIKEKF